MSSLITRLAATVITPTAALLAAYLLVRGHHAPGGGFIAGLVVGLAVVLRQFVLGPGSVARLVRLGVNRLIGAGLVLMLGTSLGGLVWGDQVLETAALHASPPLLGELVLSSTLLFEVGIALTVVALVVAVVDELGGERG